MSTGDRVNMSVMKTVVLTLPLPNPDDWLDIDAAAAELGVSYRTVTRMLCDGRLRAHRLSGRTVMVWRADLMSLREARERAGVTS